MIQEIQDEMIEKNVIRRVITEAIDEEMARVREELLHWRSYELETLISEALKAEMQKTLSSIPMQNMGTGQIEKSYSGAVKRIKNRC
ncbi:hypothetical protein EAI_04361 [Harpegnathos saltator]|uniref:Uncharacterized protein n=1 Tax=Harpegnathos saltator TaxID=610380 RepID=E2BSI2_HARSA|nr:hypothetical protein EAI_04361 [Harpegnathos saltator]